jgi:transposase
VFDAHDRAFAFFRGACTRGIYDNMKTAVDVILVGRDRSYNRRDPPPAKWSVLRYGFELEEDRDGEQGAAA